MAIFNTVYGGEPKWKPGANTIAYYPLTSTTTVNDESGNNYTLTNSNVVFGDYNGISCAYFGETSGTKLINNSISFPANPNQTVCVRMYIETPQLRYETIYHIGTSAGNGQLGSWYNRNAGLCIGEWAAGYESVKSGDLANAWHLLVNATNGNSSIQYIDGVQYQTLTNNLPNTQTALYIGCSYADANHQLTGNLSEMIIEDKARTDQEIADYYNNTKSKYGL